MLFKLLWYILGIFGLKFNNFVVSLNIQRAIQQFPIRFVIIDIIDD